MFLLFLLTYVQLYVYYSNIISFLRLSCSQTIITCWELLHIHLLFISGIDDNQAFIHIEHGKETIQSISKCNFVCKVSQNVLKNKIKVSQNSIFSLDLLLSLFCICLIFNSLTVLNFVPFGMYLLMSLLVFSIHPFCQPQNVSVKYTFTSSLPFTLNRLVISSCAANSLPLSVVMVLTTCR